MSKKMFCLTLFIILLLLTGVVFGITTFFSKDDSFVESQTETGTVQIPVESVKGISKEEAEQLCYNIMGKEDKETGFLFSFGTSGAITKDGKQYYVIRASWLVNNSHFSYIGDFFVSADGKEIYDGIALSDEYIIKNKIWSI